MKRTYHTNYYVAAHWLGNSLVLCNNIAEIDESILPNMMPVIDISNGDEYDDDDDESNSNICPECGAVMEECGYEWECPECGYCTDNLPEVYQWFITDCSQDDVEYLRRTFGLLFTYSDMLDCYILCVTHCGTMWTAVDWLTTNSNAKRECGEKI